MPHCIIKLKDKYLEWSTIVDAPVTYGLDLDELSAYVKDRYGSEGLDELPARLKRVEEQGTSFHTRCPVAELIKNNRAGEGETCISADAIYHRYVTSRPVS